MADADQRSKWCRRRRCLYSGEATMVITRTLGGGEIAFQPGHAAFLGALQECHTRVFLDRRHVEDIAVHGGFVEVRQQQGVDPLRHGRARPRTSTSSAPSEALERHGWS